MKWYSTIKMKMVRKQSVTNLSALGLLVAVIWTQDPDLESSSAQKLWTEPAVAHVLM